MKESEKLPKYKNLEIEVTKLWQLKALTGSVVIGADGVIKGKLTSTEIGFKVNRTSLKSKKYPLQDSVG